MFNIEKSINIIYALIKIDYINGYTDTYLNKICTEEYTSNTNPRKW
jgi:hypothetical protein